MAAPVLTEEQRIALIEWLAAGYPEPLIQQMFTARGWKRIARQSVDHHKEQHREQIEQRRHEREAEAFDSGLAQWETRVRFLVKHAEALAEVAWTPDDRGKLHNEKALRECLDDIAREMGHRKGGVERVELTGKDGGPLQVDSARDRLQEKLGAMAARFSAEEQAKKQPDSEEEIA